MGEPASKKAKMDLGSREFFMHVYDELKHVIVEEILPKYGLPAEAATWTSEMMDYNVPGACRLSRQLVAAHVAATRPG